jgi:hypothetical protein
VQDGEGYSKDLRERVVSIVEEGDSAREAARLLKVGASTAIRWIERWTTTGSVEAKPGTGHSRSPLNKHEQWLLDLISLHIGPLGVCRRFADRSLSVFVIEGLPVRLTSRFRNVDLNRSAVANSERSRNGGGFEGRFYLIRKFRRSSRHRSIRTKVGLWTSFRSIVRYFDRDCWRTVRDRAQ